MSTMEKPDRPPTSPIVMPSIMRQGEGENRGTQTSKLSPSSPPKMPRRKRPSICSNTASASSSNTETDNYSWATSPLKKQTLDRGREDTAPVLPTRDWLVVSPYRQVPSLPPPPFSPRKTATEEDTASDTMTTGTVQMESPGSFNTTVMSSKGRPVLEVQGAKVTDSNPEVTDRSNGTEQNDLATENKASPPDGAKPNILACQGKTLADSSDAPLSKEQAAAVAKLATLKPDNVEDVETAVDLIAIPPFPKPKKQKKKEKKNKGGTRRRSRKKKSPTRPANPMNFYHPYAQSNIGHASRGFDATATRGFPNNPFMFGSQGPSQFVPGPNSKQSAGLDMVQLERGMSSVSLLADVADSDDDFGLSEECFNKAEQQLLDEKETNASNLQQSKDADIYAVPPTNLSRSSSSSCSISSLLLRIASIGSSDMIRF